jgi:hypothetical protein
MAPWTGITGRVWEWGGRVACVSTKTAVTVAPMGPLQGTPRITRSHIRKSARFSFGLTGALPNTTISDVMFSFGTTAGDNLPAIPIPAAVWLLGSGLIGLAAIARRKMVVA